MAKPVISVAFHANADLGHFNQWVKRTSIEHGAEVRYLNCTDVSISPFGFLRLVPVPVNDWAVVALYIPPNAVLWMLEAEKPAQMGFL